MSASFRRFEILLPRQFNDGQPVPDELVADTLLELEQRFGAVSCETQIIRGLWRHEEQVFGDDLIRVFVDAADVPESRAFFQESAGVPMGRQSITCRRPGESRVLPGV